MSLLKSVAKKVLPRSVARMLAETLRNLKGRKGYSFLDEEILIRKYTNALTLENNYCVDIAASDGISMSNTYLLFKAGWNGIAVEFDANKFAKLASSYAPFVNVNLVKIKVTPGNVIFILQGCMCPRNFAFLNLDIDSYDYFVLDKLLGEYRPSLICVEINEKVPPPVKFTVTYDSHHAWELDHFYGQSISKCYELCKKYKYEIVELHYNNLFIIPRELNRFESLSPEAAYESGYKNKPDRKEKFPWNSDMEVLQTMTREESIDFLGNKFEKYKGKFILD